MMVVVRMPDGQYSLELARAGCLFIRSLICAFTYTFAKRKSWNGTINWDEHFRVVNGLVRISKAAVSNLEGPSMQLDVNELILFIQKNFSNKTAKLVSIYPPYFDNLFTVLKSLQIAVLLPHDRLVLETHVCLMESFDRLIFAILLKRKHDGLLGDELNKWNTCINQAMAPNEFETSLDKVPVFEDVFKAAAERKEEYSKTKFSAFRLSRDYPVHVLSHKNVTTKENSISTTVERFKDDSGVELMLAANMPQYLATLHQSLIVAGVDIYREYVLKHLFCVLLNIF
ncbi:uncharacterized protein LOC119275590 isoform X1 [Triticum dicoccoides]|uniref:uncharacterized protein LOC119275590 isoform X1 n=1 Tax=Triticum dicoccoides TaxID=85692 RepID=UPI0018909DC0|nr:uncharacterized protein LOC119275590 isoform X1 [Triticum dicoccoides]XP_044348227.1 uncharacterized protein LOC123069437 isoform X1 [Triticum aestivum]